MILHPGIHGSQVFFLLFDIMKKLKTSAFNLSYSNALSFNIGDLVPVYLEDIVPGDHFKIQPDFFVKFAPLVFPILQRIEARIDYWFVPNRIMWKKWEKFITGGISGTDVVAPPFLNMDSFANDDADFTTRTLADYLGYPALTSGGQASLLPDVNLMPFFAYQLVWNDWYRDEVMDSDFRSHLGSAIDPSGALENEQVDIQTFMDYGPSYTSALSQLTQMRKISWKKDYFTTASPYAQRGADVHIPSNLRVEGGLLFDASNSDSSFDETDLFGNNFRYIDPITSQEVGSKAVLTNKDTDTQALGTLNDFYKASALQRFLQKSLYGNRYIEQIANFFGVRVPDYRLQRPEFIGSVKKLVQISEILQTSETNTSALGTYAGKATVGGVGKVLDYKAKEHGWIIGIMSVRPDALYCQGIRKNLSRKDRFDFFWPEFQGIGEQPVLKQEIYAGKNNGGANEQVWAYQSRFSEYKHHNNECHGDFRDSMDDWTMARKFLSAPGLNAYFYHVDDDATGNDRVFAVPSATTNLYGIVNNNVTAYRPMLPYEPLHSI